MKGRDLKISLGPFAAELLKKAEGVAPGCVGYFHEKLNGKECLVIIANRDEGFRLMLVSEDGVMVDTKYS